MVGPAREVVTEALRGKYAALAPLLDERTRRVWAEARAIGRGGVTRVSEATGLSRGTVRAGLKELDSGGAPARGVGVRGAAARR